MLKLKLLFLIPVRGKTEWFVDQTKRMNRMIGKLLGEQNKKIRSVLHAADVDVSRGAPRFLIETKGHTKTIKRRQAILNKNFMESLTDVIANNPIGVKLRELKVEITQVEVTHDYHILNVYWISDNPNLNEVDKELRIIKGSLHKLMIEQRFMTRIPVIQFVFDDQSSGLQHLNEIYQKLDYGKDFNPTKDTDVKTFSEILTGPKDLIPSEASDSHLQSPSDIMPRFWYPPDMKLNVLGLDYEALMNKVLFNMRKSRAAHLNYNPASKPLPPAEWVAPPIYIAPPEPRNANEETPDERIQIMRNFLTENRKKRQKLYHAVKKRELDHENLIYENAELAKSRCDEDTFIEEYEYDEEVEEEEELMDWEEERKVDEEVDNEDKPSSS